jgi:hypothetical protein
MDVETRHQGSLAQGTYIGNTDIYGGCTSVVADAHIAVGR